MTGVPKSIELKCNDMAMGAIGLYGKKGQFATKLTAGCIVMANHDYEDSTDKLAYHQMGSLFEQPDLSDSVKSRIVEINEMEAIAEKELSADLSADTLAMIDTFATLDGFSKEKVLDLVKVLLERENGKKQD